MDNQQEIKSNTVWNKEIYAGFKHILQKLYGETFNIIIRKPDEDFKIEEFPCAVLQIPYYLFSIDRWSKIDEYIAGVKGNYAIVDKTPLPFDIYLQMDFYTKSLEDMDILQIKWHSFFRRDLYLKVLTRGGEKSEVLVLPEIGGTKRMDEVYGKDRLFRLIQNFRVFGRIDEHDDLKSIRIPDKVKFIFEHMKGDGVNEVPVNKHIGTTPGVYTIRR